MSDPKYYAFCCSNCGHVLDLPDTQILMLTEEMFISKCHLCNQARKYPFNQSYRYDKEYLRDLRKDYYLVLYIYLQQHSTLEFFNTIH